MELKTIICPNCGSPIEVPEYAVSTFCQACGSKVVVQQNKQQTPLDAYEKSKKLLMNAYISRDINDIMNYSKAVLEVNPNDFFADFLYAYCLLRKGNNNMMMHFFKNATFFNVTDEELDIVLTEITRSQNYYVEKCEFMRRALGAGLNISKYDYYLNLGAEKEAKVQDERFVIALQNVNKLSTSLYIIAMAVFMLFYTLPLISTGESEVLLGGVMGLLMGVIYFAVAALIIKAVANKNGFTVVVMVVSIVLLGLIYLAWRALAVVIVINKNKKIYGEENNLEFATLFKTEKLN
jgi:DNA-directed RNA polymerase subunit RPC12/RpoP